jgi:hypothetical protein
MIIQRILLAMLLIMLVSCGQAPSATGGDNAALGETVRNLIENPVTEIEQAVEANDIDTARRAFGEFQQAYENVEAGVQAAAPDAGQQISEATTNLESAFNVEAPDATVINEQLGRLREGLESLLPGE